MGGLGAATVNANGSRGLIGDSCALDSSSDSLYMSCELNSSKRVTARPDAMDLEGGK